MNVVSCKESNMLIRTLAGNDDYILILHNDLTITLRQRQCLESIIEIEHGGERCLITMTKRNKSDGTNEMRTVTDAPMSFAIRPKSHIEKKKHRGSGQGEDQPGRTQAPQKMRTATTLHERRES